LELSLFVLARVSALSLSVLVLLFKMTVSSLHHQHYCSRTYSVYLMKYEQSGLTLRLFLSDHHNWVLVAVAQYRV